MAVSIPLTRGMVALVDEADAPLVAGRKWSANTGNGTHFYAQARFGKKRRLMHRVLIADVPAGLQIDHIDGDGLNNTRANLRLVTPRQNLANRLKRTRGTSAYKGVFVTSRGYIYATIVCAARRSPFRIGVFSTERDAAKAYDACARILFGEHARVNFPRAGEQCAHPVIPGEPLGGIQEKSLAEALPPAPEKPAEAAA